MKTLIIKLVLSVVVLFSSFFTSAQKQKSNFEVQLYGIPYYKLSNYFYENKMTLKSDFFKLNYSERINQEMGLNVKYSLKKWKFGLGFSYNNFNYNHSVYFVDFGNYGINNLAAHVDNELNLRTLGLNFISERKLINSISLGLRLSVNGIIKNEIKNNPKEFLFKNDQLKLKEEHFTQGTRMFLIPELYISKNIYKGIDLLIGYKLKFYRKFYEPGNEFYNLTVSDRSKTMFSYTIDTYQAGFYFGASYTFQLPKFRKSKLD